MEISLVFEYVGKIVSLIAALSGFYWAFEKWLRREEHFPRINLDIDATVIDQNNDKIIFNIVATLENKGVVPLKISKFICELRGIKATDPLELGGENIRYQLNFSNLIAEGPFFPPEWEYSFVYPGVKTNYSYITIVPSEYKYLLLKGRFHYSRNNESHHAGKVIKIP